MKVDLFTFLGMYDRALGTLSHLLSTGAAHAASIGQTEAEMLQWRLIDDMNPLAFQIVVAVNFARSWPSRVAGVEAPAEIESNLDLAGFQDAIADARAYLATLRPEQFEGRDEVPLTVKLGDIMEPTLPAGQWLTGFATTNIFFHLSMAYAILRAKGVLIGKRDLFAGGL